MLAGCMVSMVSLVSIVSMVSIVSTVCVVFPVKSRARPWPDCGGRGAIISFPTTTYLPWRPYSTHRSCAITRRDGGRRRRPRSSPRPRSCRFPKGIVLWDGLPSSGAASTSTDGSNTTEVRMGGSVPRSGGVVPSYGKAANVHSNHALRRWLSAGRRAYSLVHHHCV